MCQITESLCHGFDPRPISYFTKIQGCQAKYITSLKYYVEDWLYKLKESAAAATTTYNNRLFHKGKH